MLHASRAESWSDLENVLGNGELKFNKETAENAKVEKLLPCLFNYFAEISEYCGTCYRFLVASTGSGNKYAGYKHLQNQLFKAALVFPLSTDDGETSCFIQPST